MAHAAFDSSPPAARVARLLLDVTMKVPPEEVGPSEAYLGRAIDVATFTDGLGPLVDDGLFEKLAQMEPNSVDNWRRAIQLLRASADKLEEYL